MISSFISRYKCKLADRTEYFKAAQEEISATNLEVLQAVSLLAMALCALFLLITPLVILNWRTTPQHLLLVPVLGVYFLYARYLKSRSHTSPRAITVSCLLFMCILYAFIITIDVLPYPQGPSSFMPLLIIVIPVLFTLPALELYSVMLTFGAAYVACLFLIKVPQMARSDLFNYLVGLCVSVVAREIVTSLRVEAYQERNRYRELSMTDALTGILNKANCESAVREYLKVRDPRHSCALLILDVDDFKSVNDRYGHKTGDAVLEQIGALLLHTFRGTDIIGRFGGDEFLVLMRGVTDSSIPEKKCALLREGASAISDGTPPPISFSIGIALLGEENADFEELFQSADDALYEAKSLNKGGCVSHRLRFPAQPCSARKVMLVADDNAINRKLLAAAFQNEFEIAEAACGEETLLALSQYRDRLAVVLLDIVMPSPDGYQILRYMRSRGMLDQIPVVVISADEQSERDALLLGAADMIAKPFNLEIARLRVSNAIAHFGPCPSQAL